MACNCTGKRAKYDGVCATCQTPLQVGWARGFGYSGAQFCQSCMTQRLDNGFRFFGSAAAEDRNNGLILGALGLGAYGLFKLFGGKKNE